jgi:hypothetical protein
MPDWLEPMAATLTQDRFTGPEWERRVLWTAGCCGPPG